MRYKKLMEVKEDDNRVFFSFFTETGNIIIGIPKIHCLNKNIYIGTSLDSLMIAEVNSAKEILNFLMKKAMLSHPKILDCQQEIIKLLIN